MVCAEQQCTNHAKLSLRSGADLKVKPMLDGRAYARKKIHADLVLIMLGQHARSRIQKEELAHLRDKMVLCFQKARRYYEHWLLRKCL